MDSTHAQITGAMPFENYRPSCPLTLADRTWPDRQFTGRRAGPASTCATATRP